MVNISDVRNVDEQGVEIDGYTTKDGQAINDTYCNNLANECLQKAIAMGRIAIRMLRIPDRRIRQRYSFLQIQ